MLSDFYPHGEIAELYGVLREDGKAERAIFVIDKRGVIRFSHVYDIDELPDNEDVYKVLADIEGKRVPLSAPESPKEAEPEATPVPEGWEQGLDLVMYCTDWCPACRRARVFLKQYGINYKEINITRDREAAAQVREWTGGSETTPTFNVKGQILINFRRPRLVEMLGIEE